MKKSNTNLTVTVTEGCQNIQFLMDFLVNAKRDYLLTDSIANLGKLRQLLEAGMDDQSFEKAFPPEDVENFLDVHGRPLAYTHVHGDKTSHLRDRVIPHCAKKAYDMLTGNYSVGKLEEADVERFAACDGLYDTVTGIVKPATSARSLKEHLTMRLDRMARVS